VVANESGDAAHVIASAYEIKFAMIGARHSLPREGWGYATTTAIAPGTELPGRSELWFTLDAPERATFGGVISARCPPASEAQCYFAGRILYRTDNNGLTETAFHRRLSYADMTFSLVDPADEDLNYDARPLFPSRL
jgi:hypothetical protein